MADGGRQPGRITRRHGHFVNTQIGDFARVMFVAHALDRMKERGITEFEVFKAMREPDEVDLPTQAGRKRVRWNKTSQIAIDVVYQEHSDHIAVITALKVTKPITRRRRG